MRRGTRSNPGHEDDDARTRSLDDLSGQETSDEELVTPVVELSGAPQNAAVPTLASSEFDAADDEPYATADDEPYATADGDNVLPLSDVNRVLADMSNIISYVAKCTAKQNDLMGHLRAHLDALDAHIPNSGYKNSPIAHAVHFADQADRRVLDDDEDSEVLVDNCGRENESYHSPTGCPRLDRNSDRDDYEVYRISVAYKIYRSAFEGTRCRKIGDGSFFDAKRTWERLLKDFPISKKAERRLMSNAFEKDAQRMFEEVVSTHASDTAATLWDLLATRFCNRTHMSALQDKFFSMKWNERKESVGSHAERLRSASMSLPAPISNDVSLNRFKGGLPQKLQDQAVLVTGDFDTVISALARLSTAQQVSTREHVREVAERTTQNASTT